MAAGKRPVPFRTRKLSPPAPMVLPPGGSGRVGYRRPNNFTQNTRCKHTLTSGVFFICAVSDPRNHPARLRITDNTTRTHYWCTPTSSVPGSGSALRTTGGHHPAGRDLSTGPISRGASTRSHDDASCGAKVEYRTSSTPAYTDELDLHYSTNNAPTTPRGRPRLHIADNRDGTMIGAHPRTANRDHTPHCGQLRLDPLLVRTHEPPCCGRRSRKA